MSVATLPEEHLNSVFAALADPTRRAIVRRLAEGDATVNELAAPIAMSLPGISKHLKVLQRSGLITRSRSAQFRPCHLEVATLESTMEWIAQQRELWSGRFEKLDQHFQAIQHAARAGEEVSDHD